MPFKLGDLLNPERVQQLQNGFSAVAPVNVVLLDSEGKAFAPRVSLEPECLKVQSTPEGISRCIEIQSELMQNAFKAGGATSLRCPITGLIMAAEPIWLDGEPLACWLMGMDSKEGEGLEDLEKTQSFLRTLGDVVLEQAKTGYELQQKNEELRAATQEVRSSAEMMRTFIDSSDVYIYVTDYETGDILMVNRPYAQLFGMEPEELVGRKCWEMGGESKGGFCDFCPRKKLLDAEGRPLPAYRWERLQTVYSRWLRLTNQAIHWPGGRMAHLVTFQDVTEEHKMQDELSRLAYYDPVLRLPNLLKLRQDLAEEKDPAGQVLVCFDISRLRNINEAFGRETGDALLSAVVKWVAQQNFGEKTFYRLMGDEFCLSFKRAGHNRASNVAMAIQARFAEMWNLEANDRRVQVLSGVAVAVVSILRDTKTDDILALIERTLSAARESGGLAVYNEDMDRHAKEHLRLEMALKQCVRNDMQGFDVHYQAIVDPAAGTWKGLEALCRWDCPGVGPVSPLVFIKEAEQLGLIRKLGVWVLERAIKTCKELKLDAVEGFFVSVNLSITQLLDRHLVDNVLALLDKYDFPGENLVLEVTESTELLYTGRVRDACDQLRFHKVRFSLDDFGTGYSSFNNLKSLPVSHLKTERSFIEGIEEDQFMQYLYYTLTELAHAADMQLITEGVETREQMLVMLKNGVDHLQGYYFSKPLPVAGLQAELHHFTQVDHAFYAAQSGPLTAEQLFSGAEAWISSPRLFTILNHSMQILLTETDIDSAINMVLAKVGRHFGASCGYVYQYGDGARFVCSHEWRAPGVPPRKHVQQFANDGVVRLSWLRPLEIEGMIVAADVDQLPATLCKGLAKREIKSLAVLAMLDEEQLVGYIGFDTLHYREWLPEEIVMLRNLAMTMAGSLKREHLKTQLSQNDVRFTDVMNHIGQAMMITDIATDEVLWANDAMKALHQVYVPLEGSKCYEAILNRDEHCEFCNVDKLLDEPDTQEISWEYRHPRTGRYFVVSDSLVRWEGGRRVHLQYGFDITEMKQAQQQLEYFASTDALTGALNRKELIASLRDALHTAAQNQTPLTLVFADIDGMKRANDTYGHGAGDELIKITVDALRLSVHSSDIIGRYGGDEFVVLMPGSDSNYAEKQMEWARAMVARQSFGPMKERFSFSYGIVENTELPLGEGERILNALLNLADDRMRDYRKDREAAEDAGV